MYPQFNTVYWFEGLNYDTHLDTTFVLAATFKVSMCFVSLTLTLTHKSRKTLSFINLNERFCFSFNCFDERNFGYLFTSLIIKFYRLQYACIGCIHDQRYNKLFMIHSFKKKKVIPLINFPINWSPCLFHIILYFLLMYLTF